MFLAKDLARKWLLDGKVALKDGNFPAVEEKSHMVLRLADGWQPPGCRSERVWGGEGWDFHGHFRF